MIEIISKIDDRATVVGNSTPTTIQVFKLIEVATELYNNPQTYFDQLSCVTGIDNGPDAKTMEVIYHLYSIPYNLSLALKVILRSQRSSRSNFIFRVEDRQLART